MFLIVSIPDLCTITYFVQSSDLTAAVGKYVIMHLFA